MMRSVLTGKCGFQVYLSILWRRMNRSVSIRAYSGLFLTPSVWSIGGRLLVSLNTPPSSTGT